MSITRTAIVGAIGAAALLVTFAARAQDSAPPPTAASQDEPYQPSLGEIMALQQERHIKLWFAGHAANWPLADYEIGELSDGFDDVGKMLGGDIVKQHVGAPLDALQKAVDGKNSAAFAAAFDSLSAGCNACHHTLDHGFIVIARPTVLPYSDPSLRAAEIIGTLNRALYRNARHKAHRQAARASRESRACARPWHARRAPFCCSRLRGR